MSEAEQQLLQLLKDRSFKLAPEGETFRLASGSTSTYYIDGKMSEVHSRGAHLIGEVLYERTKDLRFDAIGGLEVGAIPLVTATVISYHLHNRDLEGFWVRDEVKRHGTGKRIEGKLDPGARVVIVDDVITAGTSVIKAANAVRQAGCEVVQVIALVDRLAGARELFRQNGIADYRPVFTVRDLGVNVDGPRPPEATP
jgi:orotate phosphoribosyltransferase